MQNNSPNPWLRLLRAARYSVAGLRAAYRYEQAFRQEVLILLLVVPLALWLGEGGIQYALMIGSWLLVMVVELLNSAIETAVDRIGPEHHELAGRAKDIGSAAVFIAIILAIVVWILVLAA